MLLLERVTTLLVKNANPIISLADKVLPNRLKNQVVLLAVNHLAKEFIEQGDVDFMINKVAKVEITDLGIQWLFTLKDQKLVMLEARQTNEADVNFNGTLEAMVLMASQQMDPDTLFFNRQLQITGDTELGLEIKNLIDQFELESFPSAMQSGLSTWANEIQLQKSL